VTGQHRPEQTDTEEGAHHDSHIHQSRTGCRRTDRGTELRRCRPGRRSHHLHPGGNAGDSRRQVCQGRSPGAREAKLAAWMPKAVAREAKAKAAGHTKVAERIATRIVKVQKAEARGTAVTAKIAAKCAVSTTTS